jgi:hypothetical protein
MQPAVNRQFDPAWHLRPEPVRASTGDSEHRAAKQRVETLQFVQEVEAVVGFMEVVEVADQSGNPSAFFRSKYSGMSWCCPVVVR